MKKSWYSITAAAASVEISIYEEIGFFGISAKTFLDDLKAVGPRPIVLRINSPGGSIFEALAIYNRLREHTPGVTVKIDGIAASMAGVIALAGQRVEMAENALFMIHNPAGVAVGEEDAMRTYADLLAKVKESIIHAYEQKTQMPRNKLAKMMDAETWMTAQEALALGFVDAVTAPLELTACFDKSRLSAIPDHLVNRLTNHPEMTTLKASIITLLATASGLALAENSTDADVETAITNLATRNAQLDNDMTAARKSHGDLTASHDQLKAQFEALTLSANTLKTELKTAQDDLAARAADLVSTRTALTSAQSSVSRLEALCGVKGVDPTSAVPVVEDPNRPTERDQLMANLTAAATPLALGLAASALRAFDARAKAKV